jgi:hypothetical protein
VIARATDKRDVPGDPTCSNSIGWVEEYHTRMLKQKIGGHDRTCEELTAASSHSTMFLTDLGGSLKLGSCRG